MGTVSKPYTFTAGNVIFSAQVNSDFDTLYTLVNGNIDNNNINAGAAIDWTKLATTISRNLAFATTYGISTDFTMANNWINQFNQTLPSPMAGTARMVQAYNTSLVAGVWAGRTITSDCIAYITTVANVFEIWYAPSAASPAVPVWTKMYAIDLTTAGTLAVPLVGGSIADNAIGARHLFAEWKNSDFEYGALPSGWTTTTAPTFATVNNFDGVQITGAAAHFNENYNYRVITNRNLRLQGWFSIDNANRTNKYWGLANAAFSVGIFFIFDASGTANTIWCVTANDAAANTITAVSYTFALNTRYKWRIDIIGTGTAKFYINDVLILTQTATMPSTTLLVPRYLGLGASAGTITFYNHQRGVY